MPFEKNNTFKVFLKICKNFLLENFLLENVLKSLNLFKYINNNKNCELDEFMIAKIFFKKFISKNFS